MKNFLIILFSLLNHILLLLNSKSPYDYSSYKYISKNQNLSYEKIYSYSNDESGVYITENGKNKYLLDRVDIQKTSGSSTNIEYSELYGVNSACLIQGGTLKTNYAYITIRNVNGSIAIFSTNEGNVEIHSTSIYSYGLCFSSGLATSYNGKIYVFNLDGFTSGNFSPFALLADGGSITFGTGIISTNWENSDLAQSKGYKRGYINFYATKGTAKKSKIASISGKSSFKIKNGSKLKCSANPIKGDIDQSAIMLYQTKGKSNFEVSFTCDDSTLEIMDTSYYYSTAPMIFVTNTFAKIELKSCNIFMAQIYLLI